jgi:hypothetical protein
MTRRVMVTLAMAVAFGAAATLAQNKDQSKDLAGTWTIDAARSGTEDPPVVVLTMTATDFTAKFGAGQTAVTPFKLDGTETTLPNGSKTKAVWRGAKLEATVTTPRGDDTISFSRDGAWLVLDLNTPRGPKTLYFKKATAK